MELPSQDIHISNDPETKGFDLSTGSTWIYPENFPVREYQYNIVRTALHNNTLVCLPTGLGKTFIAAVVMYNFWRWYPFGKIVFLAPTKPLVAQQIDACYEVMGIPGIEMIELTGAVNQKNREAAWLRKRIIFATPQVFHNDLEKSIVPSHLIKCVVVDEAHKALGKHSYCECIRMLSTQNQFFRILALSATPGNKLDNVHEVIQNLHISNLELRDENSLDIMPYVNKRKVDIILVPLSNELATFKDRYIIVMDRHVRSLIQYNVLRGQTANISKGRIFHLLKEFKAKTDRQGNYAQIMKTLNILLTMYHAYELMIRHGLRAFCKFYQNHSDKFWMNSENHLRDLLHDIEIYLGPFPDIHPNGDIFEVPANLVFGHNKFHKLKELLEHHFKSNNSDQKDTRAIVFVEYRDIVNEVYVLLLQSKPIIRPQMFVGQTSQKQKQQMKALEDFRSNRVNVLISTSIGEEGLDVGEVDLIICFDVSQHSPIRLVQRMGRTGRKRDGHIIVLVTDGKEHENLKSTLSRRDSLNNKILNTSNIFSSLYQNNPRMIPNRFTPKCHRIHIIALPKTPNVKGVRRKKGIDKKNEPRTKQTSTKQKDVSSVTMQKNASQSIMKFLTNFKCNEQEQHNTCNISSTVTTQSNNLHNTINASNVKLLSDDNAGIDFLTLCAVKKSEEEMSSETINKMDTTYIPLSKPVGDLFNFVVPDVKILDNLSFLNTDLINNLPTQCKNYEDENISDNKDYITNIDDDNIWCTIRNEKNIDNNGVRFEDILDETSDSDKTTMSQLSQKITNIKVNFVDIIEDSTSDIKDAVTIDHTKKELSTDTLENIEPGLFENILNDSFSWSEDDLGVEDTAQQNTATSNPWNISSKNAERIDKACEDVVKITHDDKNDVSNQNLSKEVVELDQTNEYAGSPVDDIQDLNFDNSDIDEFVSECNKNNSKTEQSMLSITQAIGEIAKVNLKKSLESSVNKEESSDNDDSGWISVNAKYKSKIEENNTKSRIKKTSNISCTSIAQSFTAKRDIVFPEDSDEDFMITEDNAKKFDELESSYFHNSLENKNNYLHNIWKNSGNRSNSSGNTFLKSSEAEVYNTTTSAKPHGISTSTDNRRLGLKRNKNHRTSLIDLKVFSAPDRHANNRQDQSILESGVNSTSRQMSPMVKKIVQKINRRRRRGERHKNDFIDDEAEVSSDASSDESIVEIDEDISDFVSYTQNVEEPVDMHAHYLQTIRSPIKKPGAFHFRKPRTPDSDVEIYSQPLSQMQDSYLHDSFCVSDVEPTMLRNDSILEIAERQLEREEYENWNKRKRVYSDKNENSKQINKRKRINILNNSVSSEDEIEQLRRQVQED